MWIGGTHRVGVSRNILERSLHATLGYSLGVLWSLGIPETKMEGS